MSLKQKPVCYNMDFTMTHLTSSLNTLCFGLQSLISRPVSSKWCHAAAEAVARASWVSRQLPLQHKCERDCVGVGGRRRRWSYQLPNTLPPLLPLYTFMSWIWTQKWMCVLITSLCWWIVSGFWLFWLSYLLADLCLRMLAVLHVVCTVWADLLLRWLHGLSVSP